MSDKDKKKDKKSPENAAASNNSKDKTAKHPLAKRILKITAWVFGVIVALLLLALIFRDSLIKFGVTKIGSWIAGVEISLDSIDTSLTKGTVHVKGLRVANPDGFERPNMVELEEFFLDIDPGTLTSQEIVIEDIRVAGLATTAEFDKKSRFNITTLTADLKKRFPPKEEKEESAEEPEDPSAPKPALLIRNIDVKINLAMVHDLSGANFSLPVSYSTSDLSIDPNEQSTPLLEYLDSAAKALENFCQTCFDAGALVISAGAEAGEVLKLGIDSGIKTGTKVIKQGGEVIKQGGEALKQGGDKVLEQGKNLFESAGKLFKK